MKNNTPLVAVILTLFVVENYGSIGDWDKVPVCTEKFCMNLLDYKQECEFTATCSEEGNCVYQDIPSCDAHTNPLQRRIVKMQAVIDAFRDFWDLYVNEDFYDCFDPNDPPTKHIETRVQTGKILKDAMQQIFEDLIRNTHIGNGGDEKIMCAYVKLFDTLIDTYENHLLSLQVEINCDHV